jgi:hypothetical protein
MKANELRIGNILMFTDFPTREERVICGYDIAFAEKEPDWLDAFWTPIPLTDEWLLRFGFEKRDFPFNQRWVFNDFKIEHQGINFAYVLWSQSAPHLTQFIGHCQYVHQLQNLYFALTGQELELKEL